MSARSSRISWHRCHLAGPASAYRAHRRCFCHLDSVSFLPHPFTGLFPIDDLSASFTVLLLRMRRKKRHVAYLALLHAVWQYRCFFIRPDCIPDKVVQFPVRRQDIIHEIVTVDCTVTDRLVSWIDHMAWPVGLQAFSPVIICAFTVNCCSLYRAHKQIPHAGIGIILSCNSYHMVLLIHTAVTLFSSATAHFSNSNQCFKQ